VGEAPPPRPSGYSSRSAPASFSLVFLSLSDVCAVCVCNVETYTMAHTGLDIDGDGIIDIKASQMTKFRCVRLGT